MGNLTLNKRLFFKRNFPLHYSRNLSRGGVPIDDSILSKLSQYCLNIFPEPKHIVMSISADLDQNRFRITPKIGQIGKKWFGIVVFVNIPLKCQMIW